MITAHNGAGGTPINSLDFVRYALASTADALEVDVRMTCDGTLVFTHDLPEDGSAGGLVMIEEVFRLVKESDKRINCDLKEAGLEDAVYHLACDCGLADRLIYSGSVSAGHMKESGLIERVDVFLNIEEYIPDLYERCQKDPAQIEIAARDFSSLCSEYGIRFVNANYRLATEPFIRILSEAGLGLSVWTVDEPEAFARFRALGVCNITTRNI